jgi:Nif-specific regulatory protein
MLAYLVIREGSKWADVFRLVPGQAVTIGRAPTNQIVVKDERCSRCHAELFFSEDQWTLRDLDSRNGTAIGKTRVRGDTILEAGDIIRIGQSQLRFVHDLSKAFTETNHPLVAPEGNSEDETFGAVDLDDSSVLSAHEPATITHRRGQTRFLEPHEADETTLPKLGRAATNLCRLAFELAQAPDIVTIADLALAGLFEATQVDSGAVLVLPRNYQGEPNSVDLEMVAARTDSSLPYHRISSFLSSTVMREGEAVLARNVMGDSTLGSRDSKGVVDATSVICAPIRRGKRLLGLLHLYSTNDERVPDPDDLEFTLAVADTVAVALDNLGRREELAANLSQIRDENLQLRERLGAQSEIVGSSIAMAKVAQEIARAAPSRATVLIRGESGVGKELVARAAHYSSPRRKGPFVCLNCAALSRSLLASELFGHEQGAFTGATQRKIGKFEAAHSGTLMLDEIGEMSPAIQAKFLRVLEGHPFERVGGTEVVKVDVRVIAATNRDLERDVSEGRFRRDLYFRLRVLEILVPPLRKRVDDIPELAHYFLQKFNAETGRKLRGFAPQAMELMRKYRWPGNVRELKNVVERAVVLSRGEFIEHDDLTLSQLSTAGDTGEVVAPQAQFRAASLADMERQHILATLISTNWNKSQTAALLGIERTTLDRKIRRYELIEERRKAAP